jgi:hypothetical protein
MSSYKDYRAEIDGATVAEGPLPYIRSVLGLNYDAEGRWLYDEEHRKWGSITPIPMRWEICGEVLSSEEACERLNCSPRNLSCRASRGRGVKRVRVDPWCLPPDVIESFLLKASQWYRFRS